MQNIFAQLISTALNIPVHQFVGDAEQSDDLTMLAVTYKKEKK